MKQYEIEIDEAVSNFFEEIAIIGSRTLNVDISKYVKENVTEIISGGAKGIDTLGTKH